MLRFATTSLVALTVSPSNAPLSLVVLANGTKLPASRTYRHRIQSLLGRSQRDR